MIFWENVNMLSPEKKMGMMRMKMSRQENVFFKQNSMNPINPASCAVNNERKVGN